MFDSDVGMRELEIDGYSVIQGAALPLLDELVEQVGRLRRNAISRHDTRKQCNSGWFTDDGSLWNQDNPELLTHLYVTYRTSSAMLKAAMSTAVIRRLIPTLGENIELFGEGQCLVKPPLSDFEKHWHQDDAFFQHAIAGQVAALIYLQDTSEEHGALRVVPGSHKNGLLRHGDSASHLAVELDSGAIWRSVTGKAGDVILLHGKAVHSSGPNNIDSWRYVLVNRYRRAGDYVTQTGTSPQNLERVHVPFAPPNSAIGQEGLLVSGSRELSDAPGWAWPIWQQRQMAV